MLSTLKMNRGAPQRIKPQNIILLVVMSLFTLFMILPVLWLISASFQSQGEIFQSPFNWIPKELLFSNYTKVWTSGNLAGAFFMSAQVSVLFLMLSVFVSTITGYVFAKYKFRFKNTIFMLILVTLMIPQETTFFVTYDLIKNLGWLNTVQGVIFPFIYGGFGIFLMRQFALAIPSELLEAAKIDGCSNLRGFFSIAVPLLRPGITALTILSFSFIWNEFAWSRLVLTRVNTQTLPLDLYFLTYSVSNNNEIFYANLLAASVITAIPVLILFLFFQRQFIESVSTAGITG